MDDDSAEGGKKKRETTVRIVTSGPLRELSEDPVERYHHHFIHLIERHLETLNRPMLALDLACGVGLSTLTLCDRLPKGSRIVALSEERADLKVFHSHLAAAHRRFIFPRKEKRDRLPFALNLFDVAWAALSSETLQPLRPILRQALRVLRPGGQLVISTPLRDTFHEITNAIGPSLEGHKGDEAFRTLFNEPPLLLDADGWLDSLRRCGAIETEIKRGSIQVTLTPPLSGQPLFARCLLPLWVGDDPTVEAKSLRLLDKAIEAPLNLVIHIGCILARRGLSEIEDSLSPP